MVGFFGYKDLAEPDGGSGGADPFEGTGGGGGSGAVAAFVVCDFFGAAGGSGP